MNRIIVIAHNIRSTHNIGSLLRTADGLGVEMVCLTGYTPYPLLEDDPRLPHVAQKMSRQISKTALGAENSQAWQHYENIETLIKTLRNKNFVIAALEQTASSIPIPDFRPPDKLALILGSEVEGIDANVLELSEIQIEIPMAGKKESFNVASAAAMALYHCKYFMRSK